jgi:uncharacterized Zn-binding protein involved in type VI secretion
MGMPAACNSPDGLSEGFPDVCKTPMGPDMVPIPYDNIATFDLADPPTLCETVLITGFMASTVNTVLTMSQGDDAGVGGGVVSSSFLGSCKFKVGSSTVKMEGAAAAFLGSVIVVNKDSNGNDPVGVATSAGQETVTVAP